MWTTLGTALFEFTLISSIALIPSYAVGQGFTTNQASNAIAMLNALLSGWLADRVGRFNVMAFVLAFSITASLCIWMFVYQNLATLYIAILLYGLGCGSIVSLAGACFGQLCKADEYGECWGTAYVFVSFVVLISVPTGEALLRKLGGQGMITEVGVMGVRPNMNIMDDSTLEGQILTGVWKTVTIDPSKVWAFFDFDSVEQHRRFAQDYGSEAVKDIPKVCNLGEFSKHVNLKPSSDVLQSSLTEIMLAYFPQDISKERQGALSDQLQHILSQSFEGNHHVTKVAHGWGLENDFPARGEDGQPRTVLMGFVGWSTADAHSEYSKEDDYKQAISRIEGMEGCTSFYKFTLSCRHLERV
ncbi:hypothetical protein ACHAPJ_008194 [Fusarium lateritium]